MMMWSNIHFGAKMNIMKTAEMPVFIGVPAVFDIVEAIYLIHYWFYTTIFEYLFWYGCTLSKTTKDFIVLFYNYIFLCQIDLFEG